jgi:hypothetical protein
MIWYEVSVDRIMDLVYEVCAALIKVLGQVVVKFPNTDAEWTDNAKP